MRLNTIQLATNASTFMCLIYIPLYAEHLGATHTQIGIIGAVYGITLFISSYLSGRAADLYPPKTLLYLGFAASALFFFSQTLASTPQNLAVIRALAGFSAGIFPAALISYVHALKKDIGKFSSFGALGWTFGTVIAGIIADLQGIFTASSLLFLFSLLLLVRLPGVTPKPQHTDPYSLETIKRNWNIYITYLLRHTGACSVWIIFPLYLTALGAGEFEIGLIYAINPLTQFLLMQRIKSHNSEKLVKIGHLASAVAFISLYFITNYYHVLFVMLAIAVSWSFLYVGSINTLLTHNTSKGASIGILTSIISIAAVSGSFIGGSLSDISSRILHSQMQGYHTVFVFAALLSTLSFILYNTSHYKTTTSNPK